MIKYIYIFSTILTGIFHLSLAQSKRSIYSIKSEGLISGGQSVFKSGIGINASALFPLSPSFNIGPSLSYETIEVINATGSFKPFSTRLAIDYFPGVLLKSITGKDKIAPGLFLNGEIGHHFNTGAVTEDLALNNFFLGAGYMLPIANNALNLQIGINTFNLNKTYTTAQQNNSELYTFSIGYSWIHKRK